jgi:hypothetical protein
MIMFNVTSANRSANYWILATSAPNHVTGNPHLFETFHPMAKGAHQVKTTNNSFVDAKGSGTITFHVDRPSAQSAKIALQPVLYVPASGANNLRSIILLMQKGVNFDFNLDVATASIGSVRVYEAPLTKSLFVLRTSTTWASVSKASVAVDDPPDTAPSSVPKISKPYANIWRVVDDKDILVWLACLGHLSMPAIKRLPNAVRGIQLHAKSQSTWACEACIMGKIFRRPFQPSEDKTKTRLLQLIHSNVIRPMQTETMHSYRYIIMITDVDS